MILFVFAACASFWLTVAGLVSGTPLLRTGGVLGVIVFVLAAWALDFYSKPPAEPEVEGDWLWPERDDGRRAA